MVSLQFSKRFLRQRAIEEDIPYSVLASTYPQRTYVHAPPTHREEGRRGTEWGEGEEQSEGSGEGERGGKIYRNHANGYTQSFSVT